MVNRLRYSKFESTMGVKNTGIPTKVICDAEVYPRHRCSSAKRNKFRHSIIFKIKNPAISGISILPFCPVPHINYVRDGGLSDYLRRISFLVIDVPSAVSR